MIKSLDTAGDPTSASSRLAEFITLAPTPWHAANLGAELLISSGFESMDPTTTWDSLPDKGLVLRDGSLIAWSGQPGASGTPMRLIGAHTDSPDLRVRPLPDSGRAGFRQLAVEVYGGALLNSWLDRDLTLAGRVAVSDANAIGGIGHVRFHHREPLLRIPQLAIHLDREVKDGLKLNSQEHIRPVWGLGDLDEGGFERFLAESIGVDARDVLGWDAACVDTLEPAVLGRSAELLAAPRLDNLCSCFGALVALMAADPTHRAAVIVLFDHEEVGSTSATGATSAWLSQVLERCSIAAGGSRRTLLEALAGSMLLSADMAHGTHPNYTERHEPGHWIHLGGGPVIKHNANVRYATTARTAAAFRKAAAAAGVAVQEYSHRGDLACGSTIGPLTAAGLSVDTLDVGMAQLSMHSIREVMAVADVAPMCDAFSAWLSPQRDI